MILEHQHLSLAGALLVVGLAAQVGATAQNARPSAASLDSDFKSALAQYEAKQYTEAESTLTRLLAANPSSFEVNQLMGLVCAAPQEPEKADRFMRKAAQLAPASAEAHTQLGMSLMSLGRVREAEDEFKKAVELQPQGYDVNHNMGEFYVQRGELEKAVPYLERAQKADPRAYANGYDLALALLATHHCAEAGRRIQAMIAHTETAELHNLLAEAWEGAGDYLSAEREYERAAHMEPSEANIFDWGSELLLHQTIEPAIAVFAKGVQLYPRSTRMQIGYGISLYSGRKYDEAVQALSAASDLDPADPRPYLFLGKAYDISTAQAAEVVKRLRRFVEIDPNSAEAHYYYALSLWKGDRRQGSSAELSQVQALLERATTLNPNFAEAHLRLGVLFAEQKDYARAVAQYQLAISSQPDLADAHYRLGQALVRTGEKDKAQEEFALYDRLHQEQVAKSDKERQDIKQFVLNMKGNAAGGQESEGAK